MRIMFAAVNHDYCLGSRSGSEVELKGPPTQLQHCALIKLGTAAALMIDLDPSVVWKVFGEDVFQRLPRRREGGEQGCGTGCG